MRLGTDRGERSPKEQTQGPQHPILQCCWGPGHPAGQECWKLKPWPMKQWQGMGTVWAFNGDYHKPGTRIIMLRPIASSLLTGRLKLQK